jgi:hypothetical protein
VAKPIRKNKMAPRIDEMAVKYTGAVPNLFFTFDMLRGVLAILFHWCKGAYFFSIFLHTATGTRRGGAGCLLSLAICSYCFFATA